jgi:RND family efflux transporter MFP subunit
MNAAIHNSSPAANSSPETIEKSTEAAAATAPAPELNMVSNRDLPVRPWRSIRVAAIALIIVVALAALAVMATLPRLANERALNAAAVEVSTARPRVTVAQAHSTAATSDRALPGNALPFDDAAIFARTTGYLARRLVDIGDHVRAGQLLAEISAPDVDDELAQAKANLALAQAGLPLAEANAALAKVTLDRFLQSEPGIGVSLLQIDQQRATVKTTAAQVEAAKATIQVNTAAVQRFTDLQGFEKITAPIPGVVTARHVDVGDLIMADSPASTRQMFEIQRIDILRVHIGVPQIFATKVQVGQKAVVFRRDIPEQRFTGTVTRTADALDPASRTLLTEVQVSNPNDDLRPGMFLQVELVFDRVQVGVMIPSAAILIRDNDPQAAVLDDQHRVSYQKVKLGRDFGAEIEVLSGLHPGQTVLVYPGDQLPVGTVVDPIPLPKN